MSCAIRQLERRTETTDPKYLFSLSVSRSAIAHGRRMCGRPLYAAVFRKPHQVFTPSAVCLSVSPSDRPVPYIYSKSESRKNFKFGSHITWTPVTGEGANLRSKCQRSNVKVINDPLCACCRQQKCVIFAIFVSLSVTHLTYLSFTQNGNAVEFIFYWEITPCTTK